jgi:hypothetical protein
VRTDPDPAAAAACLRKACRQSEAPLDVPEKGPPTAEEVERRLREACDLSDLCAYLKVQRSL